MRTKRDDQRFEPARQTAQVERCDAQRRRMLFGLAAPPFAKQFPELDAGFAEDADKDSAAIFRLHMRGRLTDAERKRAVRRLALVIFAQLGSLEARS